MSDPSLSWLQRYRSARPAVDVAFWIVVIGLQAGLNTAVALVDVREAGLSLPWWRPVIWELSSHLVVLLLIPAVVVWERRFPLHWDTARRHAPWHLLGSVLFSLVHVAAMVPIRIAVHAALGERYDFGPWLAGWSYEYLKDVRAYLLIVGVLTAHRFVLLRLQGEARVLDAPDAPLPPTVPELPATPAEPAAAPLPATSADAPGAGPPPMQPAPVRPERFLVRKLRREFLIAAADIEWVQAQANYVGLRVSGHDYLLRSTLAEFARQLDPRRFVQVHRSYLVNLDHIAEIEPLDSGDARLRMRDGARVPCSRRFRDLLDPSRRT